MAGDSANLASTIPMNGGTDGTEGVALLSPFQSQLPDEHGKLTPPQSDRFLPPTPIRARLQHKRHPTTPRARQKATSFPLPLRQPRRPQWRLHRHQRPLPAAQPTQVQVSLQLPGESQSQPQSQTSRTDHAAPPPSGAALLARGDISPRRTPRARRQRRAPPRQVAKEPQWAAWTEQAQERRRADVSVSEEGIFLLQTAMIR